MEKLMESVDFVKAQGTYHAKQAGRGDIAVDKALRHKEIADRFAQLAEQLEQIGREDGASRSQANPLMPGRQLRLGDISDLPPSLRAELNISETDQSEQQIIEVIRDLEGVAAVDEILVGLWRKYKIEGKRAPLGSKLYRMTRKKLIHSVPKRRGLYSLTPTDSSGSLSRD